ncbi:hypothetical protein CK203_060200 [Vitis vinifera]|uniref:DUF4283 domain-containing protein n=1 Tax=Vitis vinifera TaxID=29760 RepID=A0A438G8B4_VITVI|nr:hypothetical protein CK203_060200 [Vitis vinifera]
MESKGGVSSWVRLGPMSVEVFLDSLNQCIKEEEMRKWENLFFGSKGKEGEVVRVEVRGEEISESLRKLEHCLIGSWNPSSANGVDLERLGWLMARSWGLQGWWEVSNWSWNDGALGVVVRKKVGVGRNWVKILGLPISLWVPSILRKVGTSVADL